MEKYQTFQKSTEKKPFDLKYMALGLGGEVGEVLNEIKKLERDDNNVLNPDRKEKIILELGDVMWYLSGICNKLGCKLEDVLEKNIEKLMPTIRSEPVLIKAKPNNTICTDCSFCTMYKNG